MNNPQDLDTAPLTNAQIDYLDEHLEVEIYSIDQDGNVNCVGCVDCTNCIQCNWCIECKSCTTCGGCIGCVDLTGGHGIIHPI